MYKRQVLNDVDFCIELMESDRINVAYIMNLIRNIHFDNTKQKDYDIKHIKEELDRTDNPQLLRKVEILQAFLDNVVNNLNSADEIDAAYNDFENSEKQKEIVAFATEEDIDATMLTEIISEYEFSGTMDAVSYTHLDVYNRQILIWWKTTRDSPKVLAAGT